MKLGVDKHEKLCYTVHSEIITVAQETTFTVAQETNIAQKTRKGYRMFTGCRTPQDVKNLYRKLAFKYHPDRGGDNDTMKRVNAMYHKALESLHGFTTKGSDGRDHTYYYNQKVEQAVLDKVEQLLSLNLTGCTVEIIGTWVWVSGKTKPHQDSLNTAKCLWHNERQMWFWHGPRYKSKYNKRVSMNDLRHAYGVAGKWEVEENLQIGGV